jgi:outer membrane protein OmpA-like peptidoglycan-associated protein/opacity protein-like surface antigen
MKNNNQYKTLTKLLLSVIALGSWQVSNAETYESLESSWYAGGAVGMSRLQPDGNAGWDVTEENDTAKKIYGGINIGRDFGLEAFWNDFGEATVTSKTSGADAKVKYQGYGANLVYHMPSYLGNIHPIAKVGVAKLETSGEGVTVNQKNKFAVMAGVGAEYELNEGFRVRAEYEYFDKDIDQVSIGLNWRPEMDRQSFDRSRGVITQREQIQPIVIVNNPAPVIQRAAPPRPVVKPAPRPVVRPAPRPKPVIKRAPPPKPVIKTVVKHVPVYIQKPAPKPIVRTVIKQAPPVIQRVEVVRPAPVAKKSRTIHKTLAGGSHFASNSASLTYEGRNALNRLANDLLNDGVVIHNIGIVGHTDSVGSIQSNQRLSEQRANSVANYLASRGLNRGTMTVLGRGESQPLASNANASGRAQNRRVNIVVKGSQTINR